MFFERMYWRCGQCATGNFRRAGHYHGTMRQETNEERLSRRPILLTSFDEVLAECNALFDSGYRKVGNWSLADACEHLQRSQDASISGYPRWMSLFAPLRPFVRRLMLPRLLRGDSPAGLPTASTLVPKNSYNDETAIEALEQSMQRLRTHDGSFVPHPGFGLMNLPELERFHSAHASHHLSFLIPQERSE